MQTLTTRERNVIRQLLDGGKSNKAIAFALDVNEDAVKNVFREIRSKLKLDNRAQIVIWAYARPEDLDLWPSNQK